MQVSVESTGNLERRINFSLPAEQLESSVSGRLREIARTARIKGFRPGKVPARVIEQRFGEQVKAEVLGGLVRQTLDWAAGQFIEEVMTPALRLPRDEILHHAFVLGPLAEVAPDERHPLDGRTYAALWAAFGPPRDSLVRVPFAWD